MSIWLHRSFSGWFLQRTTHDMLEIGEAPNCAMHQPCLTRARSTSHASSVNSLKAGTHRWMSEAFGETQTRSGTNMFVVFSCVGSFRSRSDVACSDSACEVWGGWLSAVWAIGFSDWRCARESAQCVGRGNTVCALVFYTWFMFWSTGMRLAVIMSVQDKWIVFVW